MCKSYGFFQHKFDHFFFFSGICLMVSEIIKQILLTTLVGNGHYNWWYFPFQLCSIPMYITCTLPFLNRNTIRKSALAFLMTYGLLGGVIVFADTSGLHYPLLILTIHSYLWHIFLILLGTISGFCFYYDFKKTYTIYPFITCSFFYLVCCAIAEILNLFLDHFGKINMFYINPDYPMEQIVFRDLVSILGNSPTIWLYILSTILGAFLLYVLWYFLFRKFSYLKRIV